MKVCKVSTVLLVLACVQSLFLVVYGECDGKCVPLAECEDEDDIFQIDLRFGGEIKTDCDHYLQVCCPEQYIKNRTDVPSTSTQAPPIVSTHKPFIVTEPPVSPDATTTVSPDATTTMPPVRRTTVPPVREFEECGKRNKDGVGFRITGDNHGETEFGEFPWMVALFTEEKLDFGEFDKKYFCGGSLISPNVVMTAAHCVINRTAETLIARAGEWDINTELELHLHQERRVSKIIIHEKFNRKFVHNNIALLVLEEPFQPDANVQLICLPPQDTPFDEDECFATGWGKDQFNSSSYQVILKKVKLPIVPNDDCQEALRSTRLGPKFYLHSSNICAGGEAGVDTCTGDGGSPLVCPTVGGLYQQAGIVAWGIGCAQEGIPGVYTRNSLYTEWIEDKIRQHEVFDQQIDMRGLDFN